VFLFDGVKQRGTILALPVVGRFIKIQLKKPLKSSDIF